MARGILDWHGTSLMIPSVNNTYNAQRRSSSLPSLVGSINPFTQSTDANKPIYTRADNKENLVQYSSGAFNNATYWTKISVTVADAAITAGGLSMSTVTAKAATAAHGIFPPTAVNFMVVTGQEYEQSWLVKMGTHRYVQIAPFAGAFNTTYMNFDLQDGVAGTDGGGGITGGIEVYDAANGVYRVWIRATGITQAVAGTLIYLVSSASATRLQSWTATGTETVHIANNQQRRTFTDTTYIATTDHPQIAGVNGRAGLYFSGQQWLSTTSQLSTMFAAGSSLIYAVLKPEILGSEHQITRASAAGHFALRTKSADGYYFINDDGTPRYATSPATAVASQLCILRGRQSGGNIYCAIDIGSGFTEGSALACGNATTMTATYSIGAGSGTSLYGTILGIFTDDTGTPDTEYEEIMRRFFFTQTETQSSNIRVADNTLLREALTVTASSSLEAGHNVYSLTSSKRSNFIQRSSAGTTQAINITLRSGNEQACNYLIVTKARRLAAAGCTSIALQYSEDGTNYYDFLTSDFSEYVGEFEQDLFLYSNESSIPYRLWRVYMTGSSNKFPLSNIYAGMLFDFDRDPDKVEFKINIPDGRKETTKGDNLAARLQKPEAEYDLVFTKITDSKAVEARRFVDKAHYLPVFLVSTSDTTITNGVQSTHMMLTDYRVIKKVTNYNEIRLTLRELLK